MNGTDKCYNVNLRKGTRYPSTLPTMHPSAMASATDQGPDTTAHTDQLFFFLFFVWGGEFRLFALGCCYGNQYHIIVYFQTRITTEGERKEVYFRGVLLSDFKQAQWIHTAPHMSHKGSHLKGLLLKNLSCVCVSFDKFERDRARTHLNLNFTAAKGHADSVDLSEFDCMCRPLHCKYHGRYCEPARCFCRAKKGLHSSPSSFYSKSCTRE